MNESSPLSALVYDAQRWPRPYQRVDFVLGPGAPEGDVTASPLEFADEGGCSAPEEFLRLWTEDAPYAGDPPREAFQLSAAFAKRALGAAVGANGGALVALSLLMHVVDSGSRIAMATPVMVVALGLAFAGIATLGAWLNFQSADALRATPATQRGFERRMRSRLAASFWVASASGAGAYAAFAWAVLAFAEALTP